MNAATTINEKDKFAQKFRDFLGRDCICVDKSNLKDAFSFVDRYGKAIAKPFDGYEGNGIFMINSEKKDTLERLQNLVIGGGKFMVEELIVQHPAMAALNKESVNTVRIETMIDRNGESHITNTTVIMGSGGDIINNTHNGGIMCHIDPESGVISSSARDPHGVNLFRHPDTGMILPGYQIPMWKEAKEFALKLSKVVPGVRFIGWDIAITENGPVVIEGNTMPGHCTQACDMTGRWPILKSLI